MSSSAVQRCPQCQASIPMHEGFLPWCKHCEWNIRMDVEDTDLSFVDKFYSAMSRKHSNSLFESVARAGALKPSLSPPIVVASLCAIIVHLCTIAVFISGCLLIVLGWPHFFLVLFGLLCLGVAWLMHPRFAPKPTDVLSREQFPALYQLVDMVSEHLGTSRVDGIVVDETFNAAFGRVGIRHEKILWLGLPLWSILSDEEKLDLLAHEIAHDVNNDYRKGALIGSATRTLFVLHEVLIPTEIWPISMGFLGFAAVPFTLLSLGVSYIVRYCALALEHLLWSSGQRAEYYADILAASVVGKQASISGMEKILYRKVIEAEVRLFALQRVPQSNLFDNLRRRIATVPRSEIERLRRVSQYEVDRMNISHPPTALRLQMIEKSAPNNPALIIPTALCERVACEMQLVEQDVQHRIVDNYRASLYWQ